MRMPSGAGTIRSSNALGAQTASGRPAKPACISDKPGDEPHSITFARSTVPGKQFFERSRREFLVSHACHILSS